MHKKTMWTYGILDMVFGLIYLLIFAYVVPAYRDIYTALGCGLGIFVFLGGLGLMTTHRIGYWLGVTVAGLLLLICIACIGALLCAAAYLHGIYGAFGKGASLVSLFVIANVFTFMGLLPLFQLLRLLSHDVRKAYVTQG